MSAPRFLCIALVRADAHAFGWRLLGANNREFGRSPGRFADRQSCRAAIALLRASRGELEAVVRADAGTRSWAWQVWLGESVVAVGGRSYRRQRECRYAAQRFLEGLPVADTVTEMTFPPVRSRGDAPIVTSRRTPASA